MLLRKIHYVYPQQPLMQIFFRKIRYSVPVREEVPEYDLDSPEEGEVVARLSLPNNSRFTKSTAEWSAVNDILPIKMIPEPSETNTIPSPSGWSPQNASAIENAYFIRRNRNHNFPLNLEIHNGGNRKMTVLKYVEGDIWQMEADLNLFLKTTTKKQIVTQVDEVCRKIRIRGIHLQEISNFLIKKGF